MNCLCMVPLLASWSSTDDLVDSLELKFAVRPRLSRWPSNNKVISRLTLSLPHRPVSKATHRRHLLLLHHVLRLNPSQHLPNPFSTNLCLHQPHRLRDHPLHHQLRNHLLLNNQCKDTHRVCTWNQVDWWSEFWFSKKQSSCQCTCRTNSCTCPVSWLRCCPEMRSRRILQRRRCHGQRARLPYCRPERIQSSFDGTFITSPPGGT